MVSSSSQKAQFLQPFQLLLVRLSLVRIFNSLDVDCMDDLSRVPASKQIRQRWLAATGVPWC
jgi:hypothetical protein